MQQQINIIIIKLKIYVAIASNSYRLLAETKVIDELDNFVDMSTTSLLIFLVAFGFLIINTTIKLNLASKCKQFTYQQ